jgi:uncharacterized Fe-S cluster protein YjdI
MALEYVGKNVTIGYDPQVCTHAGKCVAGLPSVFNAANDPWVDPDQGSIDEIKNAVRNCPSGALTMRQT